MKYSKKKFEQLKKEAKEYYKLIEDVYCPYFNEDVCFTSSGFNHLLYKGGRNRVLRQRYAICERIKLLHLAPRLIRITATLQEFEERENHIKYWGFIAILERQKFKVIIRQVPGGKKQFFSIFPNWITRKKGDR